MNSFPVIRPRRLRRNIALRDHIAETQLHISDLMYPIFVTHGNNIKREIDGLPGQYQWSLDRLPELISDIRSSRILSIMVFGIPSSKDKYASEHYDDNGIVQQTIKEIKKLHPKLIIATDVCLCAHTENGHCGIMRNNEIDNDQTLVILEKIALSHAKAGADIVSPSSMMDGMIQAIRKILDKNDHNQVAIMSYAVKYASSFYGPFRKACNVIPSGDRSSYQMDYRNKKESLREAHIDEEEGADFLMIKPALSYLDIIQDISKNTNLTVAAYHVSGEYAMVKAAVDRGWMDEKSVILESLTGMKRAGAKIILSYSALDVARWIS